jgi:hypothetical protein
MGLFRLLLLSVTQLTIDGLEDYRAGQSNGGVAFNG